MLSGLFYNTFAEKQNMIKAEAERRMCSMKVINRGKKAADAAAAGAQEENGGKRI